MAPQNICLAQYNVVNINYSALYGVILDSLLSREFVLIDVYIPAYPRLPILESRTIIIQRNKEYNPLSCIVKNKWDMDFSLSIGNSFTQNPGYFLSISVYMSIYLSVCLSVCLKPDATGDPCVFSFFFSLSVCLSVWHISRSYAK